MPRWHKQTFNLWVLGSIPSGLSVSNPNEIKDLAIHLERLVGGVFVCVERPVRRYGEQGTAV